MIMARNEDGTYSQVGFVKDNNGVDTEYIYDKDGDKVFEKGFTREISSTVPLQINGIGKDFKSWSITGNTVQDGTPTPDNPVEVLGCGDMTGNLFDKNNTHNSLGTGVISSSGSGIFSTEAEKRVGVFSVSCNPNTTYTIQSPNGKHIFVAYGDEEANSGVAYRGAMSLETKIATITTDDNAKYLYLYLVYMSDLNLGITIDLVKEKLQINLGSEALPYENYGYKIPVVTKGKNLFDYKTMYGSNCKYLSENGEVLDSDKWAITDYIPCSGNIFTINPIGGNIPAICLYDSQKNFITGLAYGTGSADYKKSVTIRSEINASYIRFSYYIQEYIYKDDLSKIQLELGDKSTSYEPYREPITTPIYLSEPLQAGEVLRSDGSRDVKWGKFKIKDLAFAYESKDQRFSTTVSNIYSDISVRKVRGFSDIYECLYNGESFDSSWDNKFYFARFSSNVNTNILYIHDHRFDNVDDFIASVGEHEIYYPLAEPTTETVTVPQIPTFDGTTVIDVDTTVPPSNFYGKYKSSK